MAVKKKRKGGLPKKYIKKYGITAAAWRAFRRGALSGATTTAGRKKKKAATKKKRKPATRTIIKTVRVGGATMAKRKYKRRKTRRSYKRVGAPRRMRLITGQTTKALMDGALVGGAAVGTTFAINMIPFIKDQKAWIKALVQAGIGAVGIGMIKNPMAKKVAAGAIAGGAISLIIPFMPDSFKFAGGRGFTDEEMEELTTMGAPFNIDTGEYDAGQTMGAPFNIDTGDYATMGKGKRGYATRF